MSQPLLIFPISRVTFLLSGSEFFFFFFIAIEQYTGHVQMPFSLISLVFLYTFATNVWECVKLSYSVQSFQGSNISRW